MTENCFGSLQNHLASRSLADAILKGLEIGLISSNEFLFGTDEVIWDKLISSKDPFIQSYMHMVFNTNELYVIVDPKEADKIIITKFWGFDPWISQGDNLVRLTSLNSEFAAEYQAVKDRIARGFAIKLLTHAKAAAKSA